MVPLSSVVTTRRIEGPEFTNRFNLFRAAQVTGIPAPGYSSGQATAALEEVAKQVLPREMGYDWADMSYQEVKAAGAGGKVFVLSIVFVFLILAALYESWSLPFSVLLSVPVAVFGAFLGLLLRKFDLDVYAQIGLIMLIGLSAKNAILIVEFAVLQMKEGKSLVDAALEGAKLRLRPILMTSFAFILGLRAALHGLRLGGRIAQDPGNRRHRGHARGDGPRDLPHPLALRAGREDRGQGQGQGPGSRPRRRRRSGPEPDRRGRGH